MYDLLYASHKPFAHRETGLKKLHREMNTGNEAGVLNRSRCQPNPNRCCWNVHPGRVPRCQLRAVWNSCSGRQSEPDGHRIAHRRMCINMRCCPGYYDDACSSRRMKQGLAESSSSSRRKKRPGRASGAVRGWAAPTGRRRRRRRRAR